MAKSRPAKKKVVYIYIYAGARAISFFLAVGRTRETEGVSACSRARQIPARARSERENLPRGGLAAEIKVEDYSENLREIRDGNFQR